MKIEIKNISKDELEKMNVFDWPIWSKEESEFDWHYSDKESCYILDGDVEVKTDNEIVHFKQGDFVVFPEGLNCVWKINKAVKKHYKFG